MKTIVTLMLICVTFSISAVGFPLSPADFIDPFEKSMINKIAHCRDMAGEHYDCFDCANAQEDFIQFTYFAGKIIAYSDALNEYKSIKNSER